MTRALPLCAALLAAPATAATLPMGWPQVERDVATIYRMQPQRVCVWYLGDDLDGKGGALPMCDELAAEVVAAFDGLTGLWGSLPAALPRNLLEVYASTLEYSSAEPAPIFTPATPVWPGILRPLPERVVVVRPHLPGVPLEPVAPAPVPLPATAALLLAALACLSRIRSLT